jgi:hypothetical protein
MADTVGDVVNRLIRTYLYPPDYEPPRVRLLANIDDSIETFRLQDFQVPEDKELLRIGILIEFGRELMRITDFNGIDEITVKRAQLGTDADAHTTDVFGILAPSFPRHSIFQAVRDNIVILYPQLFTVSQDNLVPIQGNIAAIPDELAVEVLSIWPDNFSSTLELEGKIVDYHPSVGGRALITSMHNGAVWLRYKRRFGIAELETDLLEALGMEDVWANVVMAGAAADLFVGRDIPASSVEWISGVMAAENVPVGQRTSIAATLTSYRDLLIERYTKEMRAEYKPRIHMKNAFGKRTRSIG